MILADASVRSELVLAIQYSIKLRLVGEIYQLLGSAHMKWL
jgi:hypothetical protein